MADAADAAAPAVRARTAVPDLGAIAVGVVAAAGMGALAAADGGYFPPAWGWTALVGLWIAAARRGSFSAASSSKRARSGSPSSVR